MDGNTGKNCIGKEKSCERPAKDRKDEEETERLGSMLPKRAMAVTRRGRETASFCIVALGMGKLTTILGGLFIGTRAGVQRTELSNNYSNVDKSVIEDVLQSPCIFVQEHGQLLHRYPQVRLVELIRNVPSDRAVHPPLLDQGMEEAKPEQQLPELGPYHRYRRYWVGGGKAAEEDRESHQHRPSAQTIRGGQGQSN